MISSLFFLLLFLFSSSCLSLSTHKLSQEVMDILGETHERSDSTLTPDSLAQELETLHRKAEMLSRTETAEESTLSDVATWVGLEDPNKRHAIADLNPDAQEVGYRWCAHSSFAPFIVVLSIPLLSELLRLRVQEPLPAQTGVTPLTEPEEADVRLARALSRAHRFVPPIITYAFTFCVMWSVSRPSLQTLGFLQELPSSRCVYCVCESPCDCM